uniref:receptor protein serine/threonine kinase n=1 Tax=Caenorhabditis japonica TaxID=281687 RepID=A0A8R1DF48_CAEJA
MLIEHVAFFLALIISVETAGSEERVHRFINEKLIPALKQYDVKHVDFSRLRLCYCSQEAGCNARTLGWVPGVKGLFPNETASFTDTCYTDGICYQHSQPHPMINNFGCMDYKYTMDESNLFHDRISDTCKNKTQDTWICCDSGHFCANQTKLYSRPLSSHIFSVWIIPLLIIAIFVVTIFGVIVVSSRMRSTCKIKWQWYMRFGRNDADEVRDPEHSGSEQTEEVTQGQTMSTSAGYGYDEGSGIPSNAIDMIMVLEESSSSGSGGGSNVLHESTIGYQITLMGKIGAGRFGNVSRGIYRGESVAVKVFKGTDENAFAKEVEIYETNMLRHPHVLRYIGSDRVDKKNITQMWLVTEYHPSGSLHDFLEENVINLETWYNMIRSTANGLAFLHSAVAGTKCSRKPQIAHRDIKSRNIMVKNDFTCAIGDLGLSLTSYTKGNVDSGTISAKCGTVRYLAPEILNGTINMDLFESFTMADVYALSLVMWEALCRCEEDEIVAREPEEVIPYFEWSQRDPTDEVMCDIVCTQNLRPSENPEWRKHPKMKNALDVITVCWSGNPTARLSALQIRMTLEKQQMQMRLTPPSSLLSSASALISPSRENASRRSPRSQKEFEMVPMASRGTKVHDKDTIESRNGQYKGKDEMKDPLLGF